MSSTIVDGFAFCRGGEQRAGATPVTEFARLAAETANPSGAVRWSFQGGRHPEGLPMLSMTVQGEVRLICQRCLTPFSQPIESQSRLVLAADEVQAEQIEERLEDENIDVIVGSTTMDLLMLVEDEALLSLPLSPRHEVCPEGAQLTVDSKLESPFAILKKLR